MNRIYLQKDSNRPPVRNEERLAEKALVNVEALRFSTFSLNPLPEPQQSIRKANIETFFDEF
jgi:hypothetical protein